MTREEAIRIIETVFQDEYVYNYYDSITHQALNIAIEALKNEPILCEDCRHRNTWDNLRFDPQYYRCGKGVKFRDYGYVREDDYCPLGERREE